MCAVTLRDSERVADDSERVAYVNLQDDRGWTALHYGANNGHEDIVALLMEHGADVAIVDKDGHTARDLAIANGHTAVADLLTRYL
jgi:ankyrin repeat protein